MFVCLLTGAILRDHLAVERHAGAYALLLEALVALSLGCDYLFIFLL